MKANELRIGNFVNAHLYKNDLILVESICSKNDEIFNSTTGEMPLTSIEPIPLTEEWLLKFGFNKQIDGFFRKNNSFMIEVLFHDDGFCVTNQGVILNHILYLHQLQNLYFALTGTELTLNK